MSDDVYRQEMDRADWLIDAGQYERAMQILTRLLANYPDEAGSIYMALSSAHGSANRPEEAEAAARRAVAALPNNPDAHWLLACSLIAQDRPGPGPGGQSGLPSHVCDDGRDGANGGGRVLRA